MQNDYRVAAFLPKSIIHNLFLSFIYKNIQFKVTMSINMDICSFCLGGVTDIPPFGCARDAEDLVHPCSTCSLTAHRKCLLDWFNSLSSDKLLVVNALSLTEGSVRRPHSHTHDESIAVGQPSQETRIHINISSQQLNDWISNITSSLSGGIATESLSSPNPQRDSSNGFIVLLLAPCPQCKDDIVFSMRRSPFLTLTTATRTLITRSIQYGGLFLGITSAVTGIVSMGYIGMTTCGLKMMETLVPTPLLLKTLIRNVPMNTDSSSYSLSQVLFGNVNNYAIDNLEQALSKGLIDPLKFSRIPVLPIVLYRMRSSSILSCILKSSNENNYNNWLTEFMISGYISSLGNHELIRSLIRNFKSLALRILQNPKSISEGLALLKGIDFWRTNNMISMLVPLRWAYDLFFRMTLNRLHFNISMGIRPRDIANSLDISELDELEEIGSNIGKLEFKFKEFKEVIDKQVESEFKFKTSYPMITTIFKFLKKKLLFYERCFNSNLYGTYSRLKMLGWFHEAKACINNDYSSTFLYKSVTMRLVTTILWPFASSKLGNVIAKLLQTNRLANIPKERLLLLGNIIGLVAIVFIKDCVNLYLSKKKAEQISQMSVLCVDVNKTHRNNSQHNDLNDNDNDDSNWITEDEEEFSNTFPGRYVE